MNSLPCTQQSGRLLTELTSPRLYNLCHLHVLVTLCIPVQCLKESYVKATGTGIGHDLQAVEFQINTNELSPQVCCLLDSLDLSILYLVCFCKQYRFGNNSDLRILFLKLGEWNPAL